MIVIKYKLSGSPLDSFKKNSMLSQVRSSNHRIVLQMRPNKSEVEQLPDRDTYSRTESSAYEAQHLVSLG